MGSEIPTPQPTDQIGASDELTDTGILFLKYVEQEQSEQEEKDGQSQIDYEELRKFLVPIVDPDTPDPEPQVSLRDLFDAFDETDAFKAEFVQLDPAQQKELQDFIDNKPFSNDTGLTTSVPVGMPTQEHFSNMLLDHRPKLRAQVAGAAPSIAAPKLYSDRDNKQEMLVTVDASFHNWGLTVKNKPHFTCFPTTVYGIQEIVNFAVKSKLRVRVAGLRHSWSPTFSEDGGILLSLLRPEVLKKPGVLWTSEVKTNPEDVPDEMTYANQRSATELNSIELAKDQLPNGNKLCRVGAAVVGEQFRVWQLENKWAMPVDTILVEVTIGGAVQGLCHGAGREHKTITDQVRKIEYVDPNGKLQVIDDPRLLKAAAGSYGLLGIVTHVWLELRPMSWPTISPRVVDVALTVPPLSKDDIPARIRANDSVLKGIDEARKEFSRAATDDYYSEWFWAPQQQNGWVHTWKHNLEDVKTASGAQEYPSATDVSIQWYSGMLGKVLTEKLLEKFPRDYQGWLMGKLEMLALPTGPHKTQLPNALHYRRGVQNMRALNLEFQVPLPPKAGDNTKPDLTVVSKVWWDVIKTCYSLWDTKKVWPMKLLLEMRIMGGSDMILAPQYGNTLGTASIGVLSVPSGDVAEQKAWLDFLQAVVDAWFATCGDSNIRPHLMKEWFGLKFKGVEATKYLKEVAYKDQIAEWKGIIAEIGKQQGWTLDDLKNTFSNNMWDSLIFG